VCVCVCVCVCVFVCIRVNANILYLRLCIYVVGQAPTVFLLQFMLEHNVFILTMHEDYI